MKIPVLNIRFSILYIVLLLLASCENSPKRMVANDSPYCEDSAMANFIQHPQRSLMLLDSAVAYQTLEPQRAQYLKAIVVYNGLEDSDSSLAICQRLLDDKAWTTLANSTDAVSFQVDLYRLMTTVAVSSGNQLAAIRYATEGAKLVHGIKKFQGDEAEFLSCMGYVMFETGQTEDGIETMRRAEALSLGDDTWSALLSYLNCSKKLYHSLVKQGKTDEARAIVMMALARLDKLKAEPNNTKFIPEVVLKDSVAFKEFLDFYQVRFFSYLVNISCEEGNMTEANNWLEKFHSIVSENQWEGAQSILHPLIVMGKYDEARHYIRLAKRAEVSHEISNDRIDLLKNELLLAQRTGDADSAQMLITKLFQVQDSLNERSYKMMLADATVQYKLQEEQLRHKEAETRLNYIIITIVVLVVLVFLSFFAYRRIKRLNLLRKDLNSELQAAKTEIETIKDKYQKEAKADNEALIKELYKRAEYVMETYAPYTDPSFDINSLARHIFSNRTYTSLAINQLSGMNFRSWLGRYRVEHAKQILTDNPTIKMDELAVSCGFENRINLYRQFKSIEGMTPSEWLTSVEK